MGFLDRAKQVAEQAQKKLEEVQTDFNEKQAQRAGQQGEAAPPPPAPPAGEAPPPSAQPPASSKPPPPPPPPAAEPPKPEADRPGEAPDPFKPIE